ncbi:MAG: tyrosine-type recombinase/integrase [Bacteroidales bacterium]|jgi:integrase|nr:tyrosine-type recombinase/integrase [Bacteroidales bacterium]
MSVQSPRLAVSTAYSAANYLPATLKTNKSGWIIEYYVENPQTQILSRKMIRLKRLLMRYPSKMEARRHINNIIVALNMKLSTGWNPYFLGEDSRLYTSLKKVTERYLEEAKRNTRSATYRSYASFVSIFIEWIEKVSPNIYSSMVTYALVAKFMDYVYNERKGRKTEVMSNRTYNNYAKTGSAFFNWMIDKCYCKENHFSKIKPKKKEDKKRVLIPEETRERITNYLLEKSPNYLLMLKLMYNSLIRPKEIRGLLISDISTVKGQITVQKEVAKNGKERIVPMTPDIIEDFVNLNLKSYVSSCYVFGEDFKPSKTKLTDFFMHKYWAKMRKKLGLPEEMQQYSLRDSGIFEMIKSGIDPLSVQQLADHHSLEMTTIYAKHLDPNLQKIIVENAPKFTQN